MHVRSSRTFPGQSCANSFSIASGAMSRCMEPGRSFSASRANRSAILNLRRVRELRAPARGPRRAFMADGTAVALTRGLREVTERMKALRC